MKIRRHRLSLILGILALALGAGVSLLLAFGGGILEGLPAAIAGLLEDLADAVGIGGGPKALLPFSICIAAMGLAMLLFRRRKRFTLFLSVPFIAIIYTTVMAFSHLRAGNPRPALLMQRIDPSRSWLVLVCAVLEALLFVLLITVSGKVDARMFEREMKRNKRIQLKAEREKAEESVEEDSEENPDEAPSPDQSKEDRRYMKMKEKMDRKAAKKEARLAAKDEKKFRKYKEKEERKAQKEAEAAHRAELKARKREEAEIDADGAEAFTTKGAEYVPPRHIDPSERVDVPEVGELPHMKKLRTPEDIPQNHRAAARRPEPEFEMPPESDVFSQLKDELERREEPKEEVHPHYDPDNASTYSKGGMIEATLETMIEINNEQKEGRGSVSRNSSPIIGFDDRREEKKERRNNSSFAPSNLSPDHPRYKLFESLAHQKGVSSFPSKTFEAEVPDAEPDAFASTRIKEDPEPERKVPGLSGFMRNAAPSDSDPQAPDRIVPQPVRAPLQQPEAEEDPFEAVQREEAEKKALRQAAMKAADESAEAESEGSDMPKQENELMYSVGIGGLQSNDLGYAGISARSRKKYIAPPANILVDRPKTSSEIDDFTRQQAAVILDTFSDFHVNVTLDEIIKGPTVTMYTFKLGEGVMVQKVTQRENELSYNLGGVRIRILAPVPGRQAVGIEVPNKHRAVIGFKDMLSEFHRREDADKLRVPMILGRTITGEPVTIDVAKMPHMLIAGTTGSGKSVCINAFICTLIYTRSPQDVRLIMVDPKVVELTVYNDIPHLLTPVITEPKKVVKALGWLCDEMDRRYQMISKFGVRNIESLNAKIRNENIPAEKLPYIVLIMDEFADLMTVVGKDIETYVARLAAKARAAGIHLILATQRPSSDVITGTIKNNFPARIAFAVSSGTNSRIILDEGGAENLLGRGDMLLMEPSTMGFQRIQGAFLSDDEVYSVVGFAKSHGSPDYLAEDIFEEPDAPEDDGDSDMDYEDSGDEELYERAKQIVFDRKCASASFLQRRMKIGYNKAARLIEQMEEEGIVGPQNGSKPREILRYE